MGLKTASELILQGRVGVSHQKGWDGLWSRRKTDSGKGNNQKKVQVNDLRDVCEL